MAPNSDGIVTLILIAYLQVILGKCGKCHILWNMHLFNRQIFKYKIQWLNTLKLSISAHLMNVCILIPNKQLAYLPMTSSNFTVNKINTKNRWEIHKILLFNKINEWFDSNLWSCNFTMFISVRRLRFHNSKFLNALQFEYVTKLWTIHSSQARIE